ncbi:MAG: hypothetical protein NTW87_15810 [Planctomycetota bacterium]|nr:hypothetical protein [Planctomycetota bacterium]
MADSEWKITKAGQTCCLCSARFAVGQSYFSALLQGPEAFVRQDYCPACFQNKRPDNVFYFWKAAQPDPEAELEGRRRRPLVDAEYVFEFFKRLGEGSVSDSRGPVSQRLAFRYILALMLARKKLLVFEGRKKDAAGADVHLFRERRGGEIHQVHEPALSPEEVAAVSAELGTLLGLTPPAAQAPAPVEAQTPGGEVPVTTGGTT